METAKLSCRTLRRLARVWATLLRVRTDRHPDLVPAVGQWPQGRSSGFRYLQNKGRLLFVCLWEELWSVCLQPASHYVRGPPSPPPYCIAHCCPTQNCLHTVALFLHNLAQLLDNLRPSTQWRRSSSITSVSACVMLILVINQLDAQNLVL